MASLHVTKKVNVYPKTMQPPKTMQLSNLDRQCPTMIYMVFFYKPSHDLDNDSIFDSLKASLEETLSLWYPAAGRLKGDPIDHGNVVLWCNNEGATMLEAVTQVKLSDLGNLSHYNEFFEDLIYKPVFNMNNISELPLLVVQVTKFGCGGYSIGVGTSHTLFDGKGTYNFLCAWASIAHAKQGKGLVAEHKPVHERQGLLITNNQTPRNQVAEVPKVAAIKHLYQLSTQAAASPTPEDCVPKTFYLNSSMIDNMKRKFYDENNSISSCSTFEIVTAHLWKARNKSLGVPSDKMVCLQFAVDIRARHPQLSQDFTGNAYVIASVALSSGELESMSYKALIDKIREAKNSINNEYINMYLEALGGPRAPFLPMTELTIVSDGTKTPYHKINFIQHGVSAIGANSIVPSIPEAVFLMQCPKEDRSINVRIGLSPQILSAFTHYFLDTLN